MEVSKTLTFERVNELLKFNPETGVLAWKISRGGRACGTEAGRMKRDHRTTYRLIKVDGVECAAHRLAWLLCHGEWPSGEVDHLDGDGLNNRIANLRDVTRSENAKNSRMKQNNTSGKTGVYWHKRERKWRAQIKVAGRDKHLGYFHSLEDAAEARLAAENKYGFTERHGKAQLRGR